MSEHPEPLYLRGHVVTPTAVLEDGVVVVDGGLITWVGTAADAGVAGWPDVPTVDARPMTVLPGLVDLHDHGGGGASFPDATTTDEARVAIREHLAHGTTSLVASLVTAAPDTLRQRVGVLTALADAGELAGNHLEGPFLSTVRCGAQDPHLIQAPDADLVRELAAAARGYLVTMTVAPELPGVAGDDGVSDALISAGALPSFGHTDASWEQTAVAVADARTRLAANPARRSGRPTVTTADQIKNLILLGRLRPGDPLPTETELSASLGVSRSSVREAIRTPVALDIVEVRHGRGTFVGQLSLAPLVEGLVFRGVLSPGDNLSSLREVVEVRIGLDLAMSDRIVDALVGQLVTAFWDVHAAVLPLLGVTPSDRLDDTARAHGLMLRAAQAGDAEAYREAVIAHYGPLRAALEDARAAAHAPTEASVGS
ncbi:hypothetical protein BH11ACT1_BH11ACT1_01560 [soil metagenome]